jgi:hypothetical protein
MKKLRMLVTSIIVIAIVSSVFSFTEKKTGALCVSYSGPSQSCSVVTGVKLVTGAVNCFIDPNWDGNPASCSSTNCPTAKRCVRN